VPADKEAGQDTVDDIGVANDYFADLILHLGVGLAKLLGSFLHLCGGCHGSWPIVGC
jgi:hypothetical protein